MTLEIFFLLLSLGQLVKVTSNIEGVNFYLYDILAGVIVFSWFIKSIVINNIKIDRIYFPLIFFIIIGFVSLLLNYSYLNTLSFLSSLSYLARFTMYSLLSLATSVIIKNKKDSLSITKVLIYSTVLLSVFGFAQLIIIPDFGMLDPLLGWDPHKNRLASTLFDPNFSAAYISMGILLLSSFIFQEKELFKPGKSFIFLAIMFSAVFLTFSRSGWGMLVVGLTILGILKKRIILLPLFFVLIAIYFAVPRVQTKISGVADPSDSAYFRIKSWSNSLQIISNNLLIGVGFNSYRYAQERYGLLDYTYSLGGRSGSGSDSSLLLILSTTGILGAFAYLWFMFNILKRSIKKIKSPFGLFFVSVLPAFAVESVFINSLFYPQIMAFLFVSLGIFFYSSSKL